GNTCSISCFKNKLNTTNLLKMTIFLTKVIRISENGNYLFRRSTLSI
ncbi:hypothetical protein X975_14362, partial [Stegodyphus mimosarum]